MSAYRRNQVEAAIALLTGEVGPPDGRTPSSDLRNGLKRLIDVDRAEGRAPRSKLLEQRTYAFSAEELPGKGAERDFSDYDAFALLVAYRLLRAGFPQLTAVLALRRLRGDLEQEHRAVLLNADPSASRVRDSKAFRFLVLPAGVLGGFYERAANADGRSRLANICRGLSEHQQLIGALAATGRPIVSLELTNAALDLRRQLREVPAVSRGRKKAADPD